MEFQHYPMFMSHPRAQPAVISGYQKNRDGTTTNDPPGKPATFPPVTVNNKDQELLYASKGYLPNGVSDPTAYMKTVMGADKPNQYEFSEYPKWLYQSVDGELESKLLNSADEEKKIGAGWYKTPDAAREAIDEPAVEVAHAAASSGEGAAGAVPVKQRKKYKKRKSGKKAKLMKAARVPQMPAAP